MPIDMFQIGLGALNSAQTQLTTTSHNIANVNTDGYSRQRVDQVTTESQFFGGSYQGTGTQISDITRIYDQYTYSEVITSQSQHKYAETRAEQLSQMDQLMSDGADMVQASIDGFYEAIHAVADSPNDEGLRSITLSKAEQVDNALTTVYEALDMQKSSINDEIQYTTQRVEQLSEEIAMLNEQIMVATAAGGGAPNDLLDTRANLVKELAEYVDVTTVEDNSGGLAVFAGNNQMIVTATTAFPLSVTQGNPDATNYDLQLQMGVNTMTVDGSSLGGSLGALFDVRDNEMAKAQGELDIIAMGISETINGLQAEGLDLDGQQGQPIFNDINATAAQEARVLYDNNNAGTLNAQVNITDVSKLKAQDYEVTYDGANYVLKDPKGIVADINLGAAGSGTYAVASLGIEFIESSGAPAAGDTFILRNYNQAVDTFDVVMTNPRSIAASAPVEVQPDSGNISNGQVSITDIDDPEAARLLDLPYSVEVLENPVGTFTYDVLDNTGTSLFSGGYTPPSQVIDLGPFSIEIAGEPSGDALHGPEVFTIVDAFGTGNSTNMNRIAATQNQQLLAEGTESFQESYADITAEIGGDAADAELSEEVTSDILLQAEMRMAESTGVNLDEEASNLLKFQQAYQAASRIISVARDTFDTLFQAT